MRIVIAIRRNLCRSETIKTTSTATWIDEYENWLFYLLLHGYRSPRVPLVRPYVVAVQASKPVPSRHSDERRVTGLF